ncbi:MAG: hypothetical protein M0R05_02385 [Bacilli bacterium]|nr:hypothetical protein [Bacilli bacterium]MDD4076941.1 hypothetical protein [Bacilli bacterium]MDD4387651.1 hypothetical protein [Bacilli bacterium]
MKEAIIRLFDKADDFFAKFVGPIIDKIITFLNKGEYTIYVLLGMFLVIIILIGLLRWVFKGTKSFIAMVLLFGIVFAIWFFFGK